MGELHDSMSMAYTNSSLHSSSLGWDCHSHLGVLNTDRMSLAMEEYMMMNAPFYSSPHVDQSDFSTGYLEDALVEFSERSKRRRLLAYTDGDNELKDSSTSLLAKRYWNSDWEVSENFDCMSQLTTSSSGLSVLLGDPASITTPMSRLESEEITNDIVGTKINTPEEPTMSAPEAFDSFSSSSSKDSANTNSDYLPAPKETFLTNIAAPAVGGGDDEKRKKKKRVITKVVYPFALVKPGGVEGDVTLNDINERILMPPTRPVRHPVGDFACRPCVSADGPGLSGKAVVALTRIQTQGRGTITIIRTKG
ncbi:protein XRI1 [Pyrus ussuriensis x Pyrus communis]|uniref:Protein XRI1 n=1 Tax=Pyrus ussuriensis x Pyrus communis TaxID=2448454 RepID=A0A5N5FT90_9ROSA|nr:protein XRI1 [Pyrus ussuriensis x Pyrus communis]